MTKKIYKQLTRRKMICLVLLLLAAIITFLIDICTGPANIPIPEVVSILIYPQQSEPIDRIIVWELRLPIAIMGILAGSALAITGAEIQTVLDNPLASDHTLGISAAAGFGGALMMVFFTGTYFISNDILISISAFCFAMLDCFFIYLINRVKGVSRGSIVLLGIALMFTFNSLLGFLEYYSSIDVLGQIIFWLMGSLTKATWSKISILAVVFVIIIIIFALDAWKLTALRLGDEKARSLGIDVKKLTLKTLILSSLLASVVCGFVGIIGFIGLVAPHISRMLLGEDQRFFLFGSALSGAFLLSGANILSKVLIKGAILPIGIVTAFMGVPFFIYLILRKKSVL
jgi:iron complex transport system permease protein